MFSFLKAERVYWLILVLIMGWGTWKVSNYVRDHNEFGEKLAVCETGKSAVTQEIEKLSAEVERVKALPLR